MTVGHNLFSIDNNNVNITGCIALSDVLARLTLLNSLWLSLHLWDHFVSSCGVTAFTVWPRVTPTVDDSGVHVCFLPLPKPSTWLPVLCWGSLSVHTAVMARIAAKQPENRTANNIRKANHSFSCWSTFGLRRFYQCEENNFLTKNIGRFPISQHKIHLNWVLYFYWIIAIKC